MLRQLATEPTCGNCKFLLLSNGGEDLHCRRYPPTIVVPERFGVSVSFPSTARDQWCGEHVLHTFR